MPRCSIVNTEINKTDKEIMTTKEAIEYFGSIKELAAALDIWPHTIYKWGDHPPKSKQFELQVKTKGKLKVGGGV
jgi:transcriptional repressor of cell division inhibition gene dicB